jgi:large subunit ribosomal protein L29
VSNKRIKELRNLSKDELATKLRELAGDLFQARMQRATGQLANAARLWRLRKDLARVKMLRAKAEQKNVDQIKA